MLQVRNIRKTYGGITAVEDVSFEVRAGEVVSLIGPNGAGKTTCFNLITGFARPSGGTVQFQGADITARPAPEIAQRGLVRSFQKTNVLLGLTAFENVLAAQYMRGSASLWDTFFPGRAVRQAERRMRDSAAGLIELVGLGARMNVEAGALACGELRLLEIAVSLGAGPKLLMLDEPAAGLNSAEAARLGELLRGLVGTAFEALLLVEHNMALVMSVSDRVVVMNFGRMLTEGSPAEVRAHPEVIAAYLGAVQAA
jgi:branched-chain amino acid transport system ATP-binding protein